MRTIPMILSLGAAAALAPAGDGVVDDRFLSHLTHLDVRPLVPMDGEPFRVTFRTARGDLTGARVGYWVDGSFGAWIDATLAGTRGPSDIWSATIPETDGDAVAYLIEARDGADTSYLAPSGTAQSDPGDRFGLDFATLSHARLGATPVDGGTVFKVWAPNAATCHVRGAFNDWSFADPIGRVGDYFIGFIEGASVGDMYKYYFPGGNWRPDPHASALNESDNNNAVITDPFSYAWRHDDFVAPDLDELVLYQLHVGTFAGRNDPLGTTGNPSGYRDVAARADHLADLGVNAVMLNPINEYPGSFSGGYNPISMFAWESSLGTPDDLKYMIDELHGRGIAVYLDVVWNHFDGGSNFLWNFDGTQVYFDTPHQDTPWGAQADFDTPAVSDYFVESVHHVMGEFRMDGYRQDAVMYMTDSFLTDQWGSGQDMVRAMNAAIDRRYPDAHAIAEMYIDSPWVIDGIGFDSQYHNTFKNDLRGEVFGAAFGSPNVTKVAAAMDGTGAVSGTEVMNYFELHDDAWPLNGHERAVRQIDTTFPHDDIYARGRTTLANALVLFSRGVPAILQGTEWLENDGWEANKIDWAHKSAYSTVVDFYRAAISMRTGEPALFADAQAWVYHINESADVFAVERWEDGGKSFVVVANMSDIDRDAYRLGLPRDGAWGVALNNQALAFGGPGSGSSGALDVEQVANGPHARSAVIDIPARGILVLEHDPESQCAADLDGDGAAGFPDVGLFLSAFADGSLVADFDGDGAVTFTDVGAFLAAFGAGCP